MVFRLLTILLVNYFTFTFAAQTNLQEKLPFWSQAQTDATEIEIEIDGDVLRLCPENRSMMQPNLENIFVDGVLSKEDFILPQSMWIEGTRCETDDRFFLLSTEENTKGSIFFDGVEFLLDQDTLIEAEIDNTLLLEDPNHELSDQELDILADLFADASSVDDDMGRRNLGSNALAPGEVDIFVLVDINYDIVEELGKRDSIIFALNLFSWINDNVFYPAGFNLQVTEVSIRTQACNPNNAYVSQCLNLIRENGQPSNAHLVHHMAYTGSLGMGTVGGLYTKNDWNGVSGCPSIKGYFGSWERICVSHEIGHNMGGIHTHTTEPVVDNCGTCNSGGTMNVEFGTIMSYCHQCPGAYDNIAYEFHQVTLENYMWHLYDIEQHLMNVVDAGTVGIDLGNLEPWNPVPSGPGGGILGGILSQTTTTQKATSTTTTFIPDSAEDETTISTTQVNIASTDSGVSEENSAGVFDSLTNQNCRTIKEWYIFTEPTPKNME